MDYTDRLTVMKCVGACYDFQAFCHFSALHPELVRHFSRRRKALLCVARLVRYRLFRRLLTARSVLVARSYITLTSYRRMYPAINPTILSREGEPEVRFFER